MSRYRAVLVVAGFLLILSSCGGAESDTTTSSVTTPTVTTTSTVAPTTLPPTTATTVPAADSVFDPVPEHPGLLPASSDVPWDDIGEGWLLFGYEAVHQPEDDWDTIPRVLYLQDQAGSRYAVGRWNGWATVEDWSSPANRILAVNPVDEGGEHAGYELWLIDLRSGAHEVLLETGPDAWLTARFLKPEEDLIIASLVEDGSARLQLLDDTGAEQAVLVDSTWDSEDFLDPESVYPTWVSELIDGGVVVADRDGIRLVSTDGETIRELEAPGLACQLTRSSGDAVIASSTNPEYAAGPCWGIWGGEGHRELWSVSTAGLEPQPIYRPPLHDPVTCEGYDPYNDALSNGATTLLQTAGCCECGGGLEILDSNGVRPVDLGEVEVCSPELIAVNDAGFIVYDWPTGHDGRFGVLYEVTTDGTLGGFITPWLDGQGGVTGAWLAG
jgi:hypothetical protein